jgi:hypothetical protein
LLEIEIGLTPDETSAGRKPHYCDQLKKSWNGDFDKASAMTLLV